MFFVSNSKLFSPANDRKQTKSLINNACMTYVVESNAENYTTSVKSDTFPPMTRSFQFRITCYVATELGSYDRRV